MRRAPYQHLRGLPQGDAGCHRRRLQDLRVHPHHPRLPRSPLGFPRQVRASKYIFSDMGFHEVSSQRQSLLSKCTCGPTCSVCVINTGAQYFTVGGLLCPCAACRAAREGILGVCSGAVRGEATVSPHGRDVNFGRSRSHSHLSQVRRQGHDRLRHHHGCRGVSAAHIRPPVPDKKVPAFPFTLTDPLFTPGCHRCH